MERNVQCRRGSRLVLDTLFVWKGLFLTTCDLGPAHAIYFATYEAVKHLMGGNQAGLHHPLAAATSGACATIASDALMNPFDGNPPPQLPRRKTH